MGGGRGRWEWEGEVWGGVGNREEVRGKGGKGDMDGVSGWENYV